MEDGDGKVKGNGTSDELMLHSDVQVLYQTLYSYYDHIMKYLMRFDHYLEMIVWNANLV